MFDKDDTRQGKGHYRVVPVAVIIILVLVQSNSGADWWSVERIAIFLIASFILIWLAYRVVIPQFQERKGKQQSEAAARPGLAPLNSFEVRGRFGEFDLLSKSPTVQAFSGIVDKTPVFLFVQRVNAHDADVDRLCVGIESATSCFPQLHIKPGGILGKFEVGMDNLLSGAGPGPKAVVIPGASSFNTAYSVYAADPDSAKTALTGAVRSLLEASNKLAVECNGIRFLSYSEDLWNPFAEPVDKVAELVDQSLRIFHQMSEASSGQT